MMEFKDKVVDLAVTYGGKILLAAITLIVGLFIIKNVRKYLAKKAEDAPIDKTLYVVVKNASVAVLYIIMAISIIEILGVPMTSVMTLIASCGLAVGLALQGALTNLAGGLMILMFKPFSIGDYIETEGAEGEVRDITIFYTFLVTLDNKRVNIPNGDLMNSFITNYSCEKTRRIDLDFKISNDCDADLAREVLLKAASETAGIESVPEPFARMSAVDDDTFIFTVRVWVEANKYWDIYYDVLENCSKALNENGIDDPEERIAVRLVSPEN